ncbi:threonyl-tRNA synthetase [Atractiella rhizophila]|nr:threonyl-tRNA synthetase [Atractiella rhizophila]
MSKEKKTAAPALPLERNPPSAFIAERIEKWNRLKAALEAELATKERDAVKYIINGTEGDGRRWETKPWDLVDKSAKDRIVIAKVNGELWDLQRPLEADCSTIEFLDFEHPEGKQVFWHSSAHVLGEAAERHYDNCHLCLGPPTDEGFFYEMALGEDGTGVVKTEEWPLLEQVSKKVIKEKQPFERLVVKKEDLLDLFGYNKFKVHLIKDKIPDGSSTTVYRCGPMIDLCRGPHIPHTGRINSFAVVKSSSSYFLGNADNESLQRIYGISFPDKKQMDEYKKFKEEAAKRDHRKIGKDQELFFFHELSPGSCFWLPNGTKIYNNIVALIKEEYRKRGYQEVITPNSFNVDLWKQSGHWDHYRENMFQFGVENQTFALKPMNCPGHCLIFNSRERSYKELPLRMADFGVIHRNEASGALSGLTRVRRFQQDDAHIFCMPEQIESEMSGVFDLLRAVYGLFGYDFFLELSTRPEKYLGKLETWEYAESTLKRVLEKEVPGKWTLNPGDGAFYGPKIDITIQDALRRRHQCATIQLDFQLPERFQLNYRTAEGSAADTLDQRARPVMIHRAIVGSIERFFAILVEHFAGKWPFWLSPRQVVVIPIAAAHKEYAKEVVQTLWNAGIDAEADLSDQTLPKRIRNGEIAQFNFILAVVGSEELETKTVNVRNRDEVDSKGKGERIALEKVVHDMVKLKEERRLINKL